MTTAEFWEIVEDAHQRSGGDMDRKCELLRERLMTLDQEGIRSFRAHFDDCDRRAYDWGLWGAAYIIHGGCGDDSFSDFRSTLISQGQRVFEGALTDPDSLADLAMDEEDACYEGYQYIVSDAEAEILGEVPLTAEPFPIEPSGETWDEDDEVLAKRFPRLHAKYS